MLTNVDIAQLARAWVDAASGSDSTVSATDPVTSWETAVAQYRGPNPWLQASDSLLSNAPIENQLAFLRFFQNLSAEEQTAVGAWLTQKNPVSSAALSNALRRLSPVSAYTRPGAAPGSRRGVTRKRRSPEDVREQEALRTAFLEDQQPVRLHRWDVVAQKLVPEDDPRSTIAGRVPNTVRFGWSPSRNEAYFHASNVGHELEERQGPFDWQRVFSGKEAKAGEGGAQLLTPTEGGGQQTNWFFTMPGVRRRLDERVRDLSRRVVPETARGALTREVWLDTLEKKSRALNFLLPLPQMIQQAKERDAEAEVVQPASLLKRVRTISPLPPPQEEAEGGTSETEVDEDVTMSVAQ